MLWRSLFCQTVVVVAVTLLAAVRPSVAVWPDAKLADLPLSEVEVLPGVDVVEIDLTDGTVMANGLAIHGDKPAPSDLALRSGPTTAYLSHGVDRNDQPWIRRFDLEVVDEAFVNAEHGVVDIYFTYYMPAWVGVTVDVLTPAGLVEAGKAWGNAKDWKTAVVSLEGKDLAGSAGPHLRFGGANGLIALKKIRVIGHAASGENVRWSRLIRPKLVRVDTPDSIFDFPRGKASSVVELENLSSSDRTIEWTFRLTAPGESDALSTSSGTTTLPARKSSKFLVPFNLSELPLGPYEGTLSVSADGREVMAMPLLLGIIDGERRLPRADDDANHWFGLDHANTATVDVEPDLMHGYFDLMGVDILRGAPTADES